ncbi:hypothetical protein HPP92_010845 [Vanilla planifolia]|uniref:Large ribosomal subunit protein bL28m n=1 Tax=Vanilla planifolia TaxID=51239 RepID=A0A835R4W9_VANPL|nr:hypothetical protein HPP92_011121 [Vanilla planifolia]KAG0482761.1 hypothetical protein HPP92_010845 [Vanilla planifolia]
MPAELMETVKMSPTNKIVMGRAKRGIFAGRHIQFGNKISEDGGNKSRRSWKPNVQNKRLFSYIHDRHIRVKVTTHALRCIDKAGGIDEYLLNTPTTKWALSWASFGRQGREMYEELGNMEVGFFSQEGGQDCQEALRRYNNAKKEAQGKLEELCSKAEGDGRREY